MKSSIVALQLQVHRSFVMVNVRRRWTGDHFEWRIHRNLTLSSLRRIVRLAESAQLMEHLGGYHVNE